MRSKSCQLNKVCLLVLAVMLAVSGCTPIEIVTKSQTAEPPTLEVLPSSTVTPRPSATAVSGTTPTLVPLPASSFTPEPSATLVSVEEPFPDILFYIGGDGTDICPSEDKTQIWFSAYPYEAFQLLSPDPAIDYKYPEWSPDGKWIAYVESKPSLISEWEPNPVITGTDTVWIMRPDGSEQHEVSEGITSTIGQYLQGSGVSCVVTSSTINPLIWSPDGQHIVIVRAGLENGYPYYSYYLTDVNSGNTQLLLTTQKQHSTPTWISNDQIIFVGDQGMVEVFHITDNDLFDITTFPFPLEVQPETIWFFLRQTDDYTLMGGFFNGVTGISPKPTYQSIWNLNIATGEWEKITDLNVEGWGAPQFGNQMAALFRGQEIIILDPLTWQTIDTLALPADMETRHKKFIPNELDIVSFLGSVGEENEGLWAIRLQPVNQEPDLILDLSYFLSIIGSEKHVFNYSFRP